MLTNLHSSHGNLTLKPLTLARHPKPKRTENDDADHPERPGCNPDVSVFEQLHQNYREKQAHPRNHRDDFELLNRL
jgi:hypothetical protein